MSKIAKCAKCSRWAKDIGLSACADCFAAAARKDSLAVAAGYLRGAKRLRADGYERSADEVAKRVSHCQLCGEAHERERVSFRMRAGCGPLVCDWCSGATMANCDDVAEYEESLVRQAKEREGAECGYCGDSDCANETHVSALE
jgi:hypothetical protein